MFCIAGEILLYSIFYHTGTRLNRGPSQCRAHGVSVPEVAIHTVCNISGRVYVEIKNESSALSLSER